jgi:hypothetical protein
MTRRGPKPGAGVSGGAEIGKLGGRSPLKAELRVGVRIALQLGGTLEQGTVTGVSGKRGLRTVTIQTESGEEMRLIVEPPTE